MATHEPRSTVGPAQTTVFLRPIAAPSILGLYGFAGATFMVSAYLAGWYGTNETAMYLAPFAAFFGGLAQFLAGMWSYRARDGLATAIHGMWGSFWMSWGLLYIFFATGVLTEPTGTFMALGYWFIVLAAITWAGFFAAFSENLGLVGVLFFLAAGSTVAAIRFLGGSPALAIGAGYGFMISAYIAFYTATALMLEASYGRWVLPIFMMRHAEEKPKVDAGEGEPGVKHGQ